MLYLKLVEVHILCSSDYVNYCVKYLFNYFDKQKVKGLLVNSLKSVGMCEHFSTIKSLSNTKCHFLVTDLKQISYLI